MTPGIFLFGDCFPSKRLSEAAMYVGDDIIGIVKPI